MNCFNTLAPHERKLKAILGPIKPIPDNELPVYGQAILGIECKEQEELQEAVRREYISHFGEDTEPLFVATPAVIHGPRAQTVTMWKAMMDIGFRWRRLRKRKFIYLQPLNTFPDFIMDFETNAYDGFFELLLSFSKAFFSGLEVKILPSLDMEEAGWNVTSRYHSKTKQKQFLVGDIQRSLLKNLPKDGFCSLGISWTDLYPSEDLNFVLGEANSGTYSGAFCFGRFEPKAYQGDIPPPPIEKVDGKLLWKMLKVSLTLNKCRLQQNGHNDIDCSISIANCSCALNHPYRYNRQRSGENERDTLFVCLSI